MQSQRWAWTHRYQVPLFVSSLVAVVLVGTALVIVIALGGDGGSNGSNGANGSNGVDSEDPQGGAGPGGSTTAAECVVGSWQTVEQEQVMSVGVLTLIGTGPEIHFNADGTGLTDYGDGSDYYLRDTAFGGLGSSDVVIAGPITYSYTILDDETMRYTDIVSEATYSTEAVTDLPQGISDEPFGFTCDGDVMTFQIEDRFRTSLERIA